jgi:hypothetical protein
MSLSFIAMFWSLISKKLGHKSQIAASVIAILTFILISKTLHPVISGMFFIIAYTILIFVHCPKMHDDRKIVLSLYIAGIATLLVLLLAPGVAWRAEVPFLLLMFVPLIFSICSLKHKKEIIFRNIFIATIIIFSVYNSYKIFTGYQRNYVTNQANNFTLRAISNRIKRHIETNNKIILFKLPAPQYAGKMPYERPLIETWIKEYYSLPIDMVFYWK